MPDTTPKTDTAESIETEDVQRSDDGAPTDEQENQAAVGDTTDFSGDLPEGEEEKEEED